jgi:glutaminyl-peptide cyclotransferase
MENIDPKTLKAVGQTLVQILYQEAEANLAL